MILRSTVTKFSVRKKMMTQRSSEYSHPHIIRSIFHHCQADVHQACPGYDGAVIDGHYRNAGLRCSCPCHVKAEAAAEPSEKKEDASS
jgi:hypothetical protein